MPAHPNFPGAASRRVAANVRAVRNARGLALREVSRRLAAGGHPIIDTSLLRLERAERRVDVDDLVALAAVLDVTTEQLLFGEPSFQVQVPAPVTVSGQIRAVLGAAAQPMSPTEIRDALRERPAGDGRSREHKTWTAWTVDEFYPALMDMLAAGEIAVAVEAAGDEPWKAALRDSPAAARALSSAHESVI